MVFSRSSGVLWLCGYACFCCGALSGLFRVRGFTQDDAHILLMESQIGEEVARILELYD